MTGSWAFHDAVRRALDDIAVDQHHDDVGAELADREDRKEITVPGLMRALGGHGDDCDCAACEELACDEDRLRRRRRW